VTLRCSGGLVATELGLATLAVARGARVRPGAEVGRLGASGVLRLGARAASRRHGYVDPAALLGDDVGWPSLAPPATSGRTSRREGSPPRMPAPHAVPAPADGAPRWPVVGGAALLAAGAAGGSVVRGRRRRKAAPRIVVAQR
jgi:hypothetical protein